MLSTGVLPDTMTTAVATAETLHFPLPASGPAAARGVCPLTWAAAASCWSELACVSGCSEAPTL